MLITIMPIIEFGRCSFSRAKSAYSGLATTWWTRPMRRTSTSSTGAMQRVQSFAAACLPFILTRCARA